MSGTKTALCVGAFALTIAASGNAIEPRIGKDQALSMKGHSLTMETVKASSAQLTGRMIAPYLPDHTAQK